MSTSLQPLLEGEREQEKDHLIPSLSPWTLEAHSPQMKSSIAPWSLTQQSICAPNQEPCWQSVSGLIPAHLGRVAEQCSPAVHRLIQHMASREVAWRALVQNTCGCGSP
jgi:hypothetical protein